MDTNNWFEMFKFGFKKPTENPKSNKHNNDSRLICIRFYIIILKQSSSISFKAYVKIAPRKSQTLVR